MSTHTYDGPPVIKHRTLQMKAKLAIKVRISQFDEVFKPEIYEEMTHRVKFLNVLVPGCKHHKPE